MNANADALAGEAFARAAMDALSAHICVLDGEGTVLATNRAWREFSAGNPPAWRSVCDGGNYLAACDRDAGPSAGDAAAIAGGIRAVMRGECAEYSHEYTCRWREQERWFIGRITRFFAKEQCCMIMAHEDITERKRGEMALMQSESRYAITLKAVNDGIWDWHVPDGCAFFSAHYYDLLGYEDGEFPATYAAWRALVHPDDLGRVEGDLRESVERGLGFAIDLRMKIKSGAWRWVCTRGSLVARDADGKALRMVGTLSDITERKLAEQEREIIMTLLRTVNAETSLRSQIREVTRLLQNCTGCEAVGIRLREGEDYPYFESRGFPPEFVLRETHLCQRDACGQVVRDAQGNPVLECMCGNILCGRFNPDQPFFTVRGSFWTNSTTALLASTTETDRQARTRNRCHGEGYESVALIPIRTGNQVLGLLQFNDRRPGRFNLDKILLLERLADHLGGSIANLQSQEKIHAARDFYLQVLRDAPALIWRAGLDAKCDWFNKTWLAFTGRTLEQELGDGWTDGVHPEDRPGCMRTYLEAFHAQRPFSMEYRLRHVSGNYRWLLDIGSPLHDLEGRFAGFIGYCFDITERQQALLKLTEANQKLERSQVATLNLMEDLKIEIEKHRQTELSLRESEIRYRQLVDNSPLPILAHQDGRFVFVNRAALTLFGAPTPEALLGTSIFDRVHADDLERVKARVRQVETVGCPEPVIEERLLRLDGRIIYAEVASTVFSSQGRRGVQIIIRDITERKQLEAQLRQSQKLESVGQLAGGVAHDFNNILSAIMMHLSFLEELPQLAPDVRETLGELMVEAKRAANLTRQLLMFSRRSIMEVKTLDLNELVANLLKMLGRLIGENITVQFDRRELGVMVDADPGMIEQVLMNLAVNARDAMPQGGRLVISLDLVHVEAARLEGHPEAQPGSFVCVTVADNGCGMEEAIRKRIFEPFFTTKEPGKGTGLGLATVHGIIAQHKGWVEVESELAKGTSFRVFLPAHGSPATAQRPEESKADKRGRETILVVEDEVSVRRPVVRNLRNQGYQVYEAPNGQMAMKLWQAHGAHVDLLFTDMVMPEGMTGLELAERLRAEKPGLRIIICSGYNTEMMLHGKPTAAGIIYLQKPFHLAQMCQAIRQSLDWGKDNQGSLAGG